MSEIVLAKQHISQMMVDKQPKIADFWLKPNPSLNTWRWKSRQGAQKQTRSLTRLDPWPEGNVDT